MAARCLPSSARLPRLQALLRSEFDRLTVLTIAHRLGTVRLGRTATCCDAGQPARRLPCRLPAAWAARRLQVIDYDRLLVMGAGTLLEEGGPSELLAREGGVLHRCSDACHASLWRRRGHDPMGVCVCVCAFCVDGWLRFLSRLSCARSWQHG